MKSNLIRLAITIAALVMTTGTVQAGKTLSEKALYAQFQNPDNRYKPFVRWWWNGDAVEADELVRELHLLKEAGIGGVEINPISMPGGSDRHGHKTLTWLSDEWIDMLKVVFDEAHRLGMTCDLLVGSGWPFGAEDLPRNERAMVLLTAAIPVNGGGTTEISEYDIFKRVDPGVTVVNQRRAPRLLAAYITPDSISSLSEAKNVTSGITDGVLTVDVPQGKHMLYALVEYESFASVINGAPGAAGSIVDHMNAKAVENYLNHMNSTIEKRLGPLSKHIRAFFVDSMELEGCNWTQDFAAEFLKKRGYDIMSWLPFLMFKVGRLGEVTDYNYGAKKSPEFQQILNRVRFDYELTKAELLRDRYSKTFYQWCHDRGVKSRSQAYGRGFFIEESSMYVDIPEGESWTTNWLRHRVGEEMPDSDYRRGRSYTMINKYVSSAAHLQGKRLISAEEMTNTYRAFETTLEFLKVGSDMNAMAGITHSVWHGFNYSPLDVKFPGWVQYGSFYNERNTWWPYWKYLNAYRARTSSILQNADMQASIAILPANADMWSELGVQTEPFPARLNVNYTSLIWEAIHKCGGGADYLSELILKDCSVSKGTLKYGPREYKVLILPEVKGTTQEALDKMLEFVKAGGKVICIGCYPDRSLGYKDYEARDAKVRATVEELKQYPSRFILAEKPEDGRWLEWYQKLMKEQNLPHYITISNPDRFVLHNYYHAEDGSDVFFIMNANIKERRTADLEFPSNIIRGRQLWFYDASNGERYAMPLSAGKLHLEMGPSESALLIFNNARGGKAKPVLPLQGKGTQEITGWHLKLHHAYTDSISEMDMHLPEDLLNTDYKTFMGDITYTAKFTVSGSKPHYLNLGNVYDIAEVTVNGKPVGLRWYGDKVFDISRAVRSGENTISVKVTTLMDNYMQTLKDNSVARRFVIKRNHKPKSMGIVGAVTIYE